MQHPAHGGRVIRLVHRTRAAAIIDRDMAKSSKTVNPLPDVGGIPSEMMGPAMMALKDDRQRKFAYLMACGEPAAVAAREAGFSSLSGGDKVNGFRLSHRPSVQAAIEEVARVVLIGLAPLAIQRLKEILTNPNHPELRRSIELVLDRTGFAAQTEHKVVVEHMNDGRFLEMAARLAAELGIGREKLVGPNLIEGKVNGNATVESEPAG